MTATNTLSTSRPVGGVGVLSTFVRYNQWGVRMYMYVNFITRGGGGEGRVGPHS